MTDTDVLIVGAGPTGLMLANQLARRGVRAIDHRPPCRPALQTRALGVQARTLEIYRSSASSSARSSSAARAPAPTCGPTAQAWRACRWATSARASRPYPYILILGQDDNERMLGESAPRLGGSGRVEHRAHRPRRRTAIGVTATLKLPDGSLRDAPRGLGRRLRRRAQRGARTQRHRLSGRALRARVLRGRHRDDRADGADELNVYLWRDGFHLLFPMRGKDHWRIVGILPAGAARPRRCDLRRGAAVAARGGGWRLRSDPAPGSRPTASITAAPSASASAAASCSATPRTSTARSARRA